MAALAASDAISALAALMAADGRIARQCSFCYELRLHRARGYGALKAILEILADEEGLTLTEISLRLQRTPGSTKDYLSWLEDVDLVTSRQKRYSFTDPLLRALGAAPLPSDRADRRRSRARDSPLRAPRGCRSCPEPRYVMARRWRAGEETRSHGDYRDRLSLARSACLAASCSASFLLGPLASASDSPSTITSTRETASGDRGRPRRQAGTRAAARSRDCRYSCSADLGSWPPGPCCRTSATSGAELARDEGAGLLDAAVEIDCRNERLVAVRQQRLLLASARLFLTLAEQQVVAEGQPLRLTGERRRGHERRLHPGFLPLVELGKLAEEQVGHDEAQDGVAEELERLVVDHAAAGILVGPRRMGHRVLEQPAVPEPVVNRAFQRLELVAQRDDAACLAARCDGCR